MRDVVELSVPSATRYGATLRYIALSMAAHAEFDIDRVEDARLAIDEAFAIMLSLRAPRIRCTLTSSVGTFTAEFSSVGRLEQVPSAGSFARTVLQSLTTSLALTQDGEDVRLGFSLEQQASVAP